MSVGSGSIKRAAEKATEAPMQAEVNETVIANPTEQTKEAVSAAKKESKSSAKKETAKTSSKKAPVKTAQKKESTAPTEEGKEFMAEEVAKSTNESCQLTQEMPIYLL